MIMKFKEYGSAPTPVIELLQYILCLKIDLLAPGIVFIPCYLYLQET